MLLKSETNELKDECTVKALFALVKCKIMAGFAAKCTSSLLLELEKLQHVMIKLLWLPVVEGKSLLVDFSLACQHSDDRRVNHCCIVASP